MEKPLIHVYTGDGKGKTTSAFGLAARCAGNGYQVKIIQFLKTDDTGELKFFKSADNLFLYRFETHHGFTCDMNEEELKTLENQCDKAMRFALMIAQDSDCDMLVLDEIICAYNCGLVSEEKIKELIDSVNLCELVFTGRNAPEWLIENADYVTEMNMIKHPYERSVPARKGIEF